MASQLTDIVIGPVVDTNKQYEYIILHVLQPTNLEDLLIFDNTYTAAGKLSNLQPHMFRFPARQVLAGDRILLFSQEAPTGQILPNGPGQGNTHYFSWGLDHTIWNNDGDKATLVRISHESKRSER